MNEVLTYIFINFIPSKLVTFDEKDPPWMNEYVRNKIKWKNKIYNSFVKNGCTPNDHKKPQEAINLVSGIINKRENDYNGHPASKLNDPSTNAKTYWLILKTFYNGKKIAIIPMLLVNDEIISGFKAKANLFNNFFSSRCTPLENNGSLPVSRCYVTLAKLSSINSNHYVFF